MLLGLLLLQASIVDDYSASREKVTWTAQCKFGDLRIKVENGFVSINGNMTDKKLSKLLLVAISDENHKILCNDALRQFQVVHSVHLTGASDPKVTFVARITLEGRISYNRPFIAPEGNE